MEYRLEVFDTWGRRVAIYHDVPVLEVTSALVDDAYRVRGLLSQEDTRIGHGFRVEVWLDGERIARANVVEVTPIRSDTKRLILERYVDFHAFLAFEAVWRFDGANRRVTVTHVGELVSDAVKRAINRTLGPIHYGIEHAAYPDGAIREYNKFNARKTSLNELEFGGITSGQWVGSGRIDTTDVYAKDGDTIAGLRVDGIDWPDLRLMMIDAEETFINAHAISRHPEVAEWTAAQYAASHYKVQADTATATLQGLIDSNGIDFIELNPHVGPDGAFDDRVDAYGRYLGLVYGGGRCFNAALVELDCADVLLYDDGRGHVPEMELKDFYSYVGPQADTVDTTATSLAFVDTNINVFEWLTTLGYAAGGFGWQIDQEFCVTFRRLDRIDRVVFDDVVENSIEWETHSDGLVNVIAFTGNEAADGHSGQYTHDESIQAFGERDEHVSVHAIIDESDADALVGALLDDVAFPSPAGRILAHHGDPKVRAGDVIELRRNPLGRITPELDGEWGGRFPGRLVARARSVTHTFEGRHVKTRIELTSPLRTLERPLSAIERSQAGDRSQFQFRLDDDGVGLDSAHHLD